MALNDIFAKYFCKAFDIPSFRKPDICKQCGGLCCKGCGCHISPNDLLDLSKESIINLIDESQCISIDWWEGNPLHDEQTDEDLHKKVYFLRIRNKERQIIDPAFGPNECAILTETGCPLSFEYRPRGGRELLPVENMEDNCIIGYSKKDCCIDWIDHQDVLVEVYNHYHQLGMEDANNPVQAILNLFKSVLLSDTEGK